MSFISNIIAKIDDLINRIPHDLSGQLRKLFFFILFVLVFVAIYIGYNLGVKGSRIPGRPLIEYTDDILRLKKRKSEKESRLNLVEDDDLIINISDRDFLEKSKVNQNSGKSPLLRADREDRYMGVKDIRGIKGGGSGPLDNLEEIEITPIGIHFDHRFRTDMNKEKKFELRKDGLKKELSDPFPVGKKKENPEAPKSMKTREPNKKLFEKNKAKVRDETDIRSIPLKPLYSK